MMMQKIVTVLGRATVCLCASAATSHQETSHQAAAGSCTKSTNSCHPTRNSNSKFMSISHILLKKASPCPIMLEISYVQFPVDFNISHLREGPQQFVDIAQLMQTHPTIDKMHPRYYTYIYILYTSTNPTCNTFLLYDTYQDTSTVHPISFQSFRYMGIS